MVSARPCSSLYGTNIHKRATLACAARLADTKCPQSHPADAWSYTI